MRVAGLGCRKGVSAAEVLAAVAAAQRARGLAAVDALATVPAKRDEPALAEAARLLGLPLHIAAADALAEAMVLSRSPASQAVAGTGSASEGAALGVAGPNARLLGPRLVVGRVTCAIAESEETR